jgi:hypothetical protein
MHHRFGTRLRVAGLISLRLAIPVSHVAPARAGAGGPAVVLRPGETYRAEGLAVVVPQPGHGAWASALGVNGGRRWIGVQTGADGSVTVHRSGLHSAPAASPGSAPASACSDGAYDLFSASWNKMFKWRFNVSSTPSGLNHDDTTGELRDAVTNITHADNDCGLSDKVSATSNYEGSTTKPANVGTDSSCKSSDGTSVVAFGDLLSTDLGITCWWSIGNNIQEADFKLNKTEFTWTIDIGSKCQVKYVVEDVATHEFGHVFGLDSVSEILHPALTMSLVMLPCQRAETSLGLGDLLGLEALY